MADVAASAGVSLKTVFAGCQRCSQRRRGMELSARVNGAIQKLGYQCNLVATGLKSETGTTWSG